MKREQKEALVEEISKQISNYSSIIVADFTGINVKGITELRRNLRENEANLRIVKNTLLRRAAYKSSMEDLVQSLDGPTALVMSDDAVSGAKVITAFAKKDNRPQIKLALIEGSIMEPEEVKKIAFLPPRPVLIARVMGSINSPLVQTVSLMRGVLVKFLLTLEALKETREKGE